MASTTFLDPGFYKHSFVEPAYEFPLDMRQHVPVKAAGGSSRLSPGPRAVFLPAFLPSPTRLDRGKGTQLVAVVVGTAMPRMGRSSAPSSSGQELLHGRGSFCRQLTVIGDR